MVCVALKEQPLVTGDPRMAPTDCTDDTQEVPGGGGTDPGGDASAIVSAIVSANLLAGSERGCIDSGEVWFWLGSEKGLG